ncbi:MAG: ABC transporter ATP-binding protein [Opitutae bacterium]|nr:ABC transporter ATP-binding protein [Opitutae bacterium]
MNKSDTSPAVSSQDDDVLIKVQNVGKLFCRNLKTSLMYGARDGLGDLIPGIGRKYDSSGDPILRKGEFWANKGVSFELKRGECIGLIGHNGAGKTTLLKMLNGLIKPDFGRIEMRGRVGALIALGAGFSPILTGRENVYVAGSVLGLSKKEIDEKYDSIVEFAELEEFMESPVQNYSSGMQVRLGFAVASAMKPDVLLLDEVLAVGDVGFQAKCFNTLAQLREQGVPFILVSHNMHQIARYCDTVLYLEKGEEKFYGNAEEGIHQFLSDMSETNATVLGPDWSQINGSGKIVITGAHFSDLDGNSIDQIEVGSSVRFGIDFECREEIDQNVVLEFSIRSQGNLVFQYSTRRIEGALVCLPNRGSIHTVLSAIPANFDTLDFYFTLMNGSTNEIYDWKRDFRLKVKRNSTQQGLLNLTCDLSVSSQ